MKLPSDDFPCADNPRFAGYDVVGDIHGCAGSLIELLDILGYVKLAGVFQYHNQRHPRQLVFLGDILDRGPKIREAILIIREMVEAGSAQIIMGNHEYSALGYTTPTPDSHSTDYVRAHNDSHTRSIRETLDQFANHPIDWADTLSWLYEWPLILQFNHFRVAHACWDQSLVDEFFASSPDLTIDPKFVIESADYKNFAAKFVNRITRGVSLLLPDNQSMTSVDGYTRRTFRVKFWVDNPEYYKDIEFQPDRLARSLADREVSVREKEYLPFYGPEERHLFVGHYWLQGTPAPIKKNIACLDYSAVKGGKLVAYRMDGEVNLSAKNFVWVDAVS